MAAADFWSALGAALQGGQQSYRQADLDEQNRKKQAIEMAIMKQDADLAQRRETREAGSAKSLEEQKRFNESMALANAGFKGPINQSTLSQLHPLVRDIATQEIPQPTAPATLLDINGDVLERGATPPEAPLDQRFREFKPTESEKVRIALSNQAAQTARADTARADRQTHDQQIHDDKAAAEQRRHEEFLTRLTVNANNRNNFTSPQELAAVDKLNARYQANTKASQVVQNQYGLMTDAWNRWKSGESTDKGAVSQAVLVTFQKILDPNSVVRESEYARSAEGLGLLNRLSGMAEKISVGGAGVPDAVLQEYVNTAKLFHDRAVASMEREKKRVLQEATHYRLPVDLIVGDDTPAAPGTPTPTDAAPGTGKTPTPATLSPYEQYLQRNKGKQ